MIMKRYLLLVSAAGAIAATPAMAAPLILTGNYMQVSISDYGTFGMNTTSSPAFIHDPSGTGTFDPNYDYIAPGVPHDGFSINSDQTGFRENANYSYSNLGFNSPSLLTGTGYDNAATWTGGNSYVEITNSYFFNNGDERILITSQITALSDLTNLAFARSVDPDSDSRSHGYAETNNQRGNDLFGPDDFIGSAGAISGYTLAIVNVDDAGFAHTTSINYSCCNNINPYDVLNHSGGDMGLSSYGDHGLNLAYMIGDLSAGSSVTLTYAYAVGERISDTGGPTLPGDVIPEPATWGMMILGFGLVGGAMRRQRRLDAVSAA